MEQEPQSNAKVPHHVMGEVAMKASPPAEVIPMQHVATPPDIALGPLNEGNQAWIDGVRAHNAAVRRAALADASEKGIVIPAR